MSFIIVFAIIASEENIIVNDICSYDHENFASRTMCLTLSHSQEVFCDINDYKCSLCNHKNHVLVYCIKEKIKIQLKKYYIDLTMKKNYIIFLFEQDMIQVKHEMN
jgi:hypothetical protein